MTDEDDAPVYPLLGYGTGAADDAVIVSLELATDHEEYEKREGSWVSAAMTPDNAIELGRQLIAEGEKAKAGIIVN